MSINTYCVRAFYGSGHEVTLLVDAPDIKTAIVSAQQADDRIVRIASVLDNNLAG